MATVAEILGRLFPILPYVLLAIFLAIFGIICYLLFIIRAARTGQAPPAAAAEGAEPVRERGEEAVPSGVPPSVSPYQLRQSFARALKLLKGSVAGKNYRYQIPWFLLIGEAGSGKTALLGNTGLSLPLGRPDGGGSSTGRGCQWWFFDQGIVLDIAGDYVLRADGHSADDRGWQTLVRLLQQHRAERPIDGVILTLPCMDLIGPPQRSADRLRTAEHKATQLHMKLWEAQKLLGMSFPVYILVTKCDQLVGFRSFCAELSPRRQEDMFGWSSPYALETAYAPPWLDEAFQNLQENLYRTQLEMFAERQELWDSDGLFLFPGEFQSMAEPLRVYLNTLFRQSVYHESFFLRGLYFCGDAKSDPPAQPVSAEESATGEALAVSTAGLAPSPLQDRKQPLFLKHLFEDKIFPEAGLARPAARTLLSRNRTTLIAQSLLAGIVLVGGLGLWIGYTRLSDVKHTLLPVLTEIAGDMQETQEMLIKKEKVDHAVMEENTQHLLTSMANIRTGLTRHMRALFIPSSWFSSLHAEISRSFVVAYNGIILRGLYYGLHDKAKALLSRRVMTPPDAGGPGIVFLWETPEFINLRTFIEDIAEFEKHSALYETLRTPGVGDLKGLAEVARYVFDIELPPEFFQDTGYYEDALKDATFMAFDPMPFKAELISKTREFVQPVYHSLFTTNAVLGRLQDLSRTLERVTQESRRDSQPGDHGVKALRDLWTAITRTQAILARAELEWLARDTLDLGQSFQHLLASIHQSKLLGPDVQAWVQKTGEEAFQRLRAELARQRTSLTGPLLQRQDGKVQLELSTDLLALKVALESFQTQPFRVQEVPQTASKPRYIPRTRLTWNTKLLEEALKLYRAYDLFSQGDLKSVPPSLEGAVAQVALNRLAAGMNALIGQAQQFASVAEGAPRLRGEEHLRAEIKSFREASQLLNQLLDIFDQLGLATSALELSEVVASQASHLLGIVDQLLVEEGLYTVKGGSFSWWNGSQPLAAAAFDVRDATELAQYLELQRERIRYLAREYAEPLVTLLGSRASQRDPAAMRFVARWQGILAELDKYESKKPGNSVVTLEKFLLSELDELTTENCLQKIAPKDLAAPAGDFFLHIRNGLRRDLYRQCQALASQEAFTAYTELGELFNRRLAGKFPFSDGAVGRSDAEADPVAIRDFYRLFDRNLKLSREILAKSPPGRGPGEQPLEFLKQMEAVRAFLAPFLEGGSKAPLFTFDVDFLVNREQEVGGHHIITWTLDVGDQKFQMYGSERQGRWRFGNPIRLSLRWAKDSPVTPVPDGSQSGVKTVDRTVVYEYTNRWSLISLLRNHVGAEGEFDQLEDPNPHTLRFIIPTQRGGETNQPAGAQAGEGPTKVFMRLAIMSADKQESLVLPRFPKRAPLSEPRARN